MTHRILTIAIGATLTFFAYLCAGQDSGAGQSERPLNQRHYGYMVGRASGGCSHELRHWTSEHIRQFQHDHVVRFAPTGDWVIFVPKAFWGRPATDEATILVATSADVDPVQHRGYRFIRFVGPNSFLVSDSKFNTAIIGRNGNIIPASDIGGRATAVSHDGQIAVATADGRTIQIWPLVDNYRASSEPEQSVVLEASSNETIIDAQWFGCDVLAVELGTQLGAHNRIVLLDVEGGVVIKEFMAYRLVSGYADQLICIARTTGGKAKLIFTDLEAKVGCSVVDIELDRDEWVTSASPDGKLIMVASHAGTPPSSSPKSTIRRTSQPLEPLEEIRPGSAFHGWWLCLDE